MIERVAALRTTTSFTKEGEVYQVPSLHVPMTVWL